MSEPSCPGCGETEALRGRPVDDDVEVTCERCGAVWLRGRPRCRKCGRPGGVIAQQRMTRHPRGTLLAVVGVHQVTVCPDCDREVAEAAQQRNRPVPDGYRSRFVHGEDAEAGQEAPRPSQETRRERRGSPSTYVGPVGERRPAASASAPDDPTVRQATEAFLEQAEDAASVAMVMLGAHLGASTRLSRLEIAPSELADWVDRTFAGGGRDAAASTIRAAFGFWHEQGWLDHDPGPEIE